MSRHPALQIDLMTTDQRQDLVTEGLDVAFRQSVKARLSLDRRLKLGVDRAAHANRPRGGIERSAIRPAHVAMSRTRLDAADD